MEITEKKPRKIHRYILLFIIAPFACVTTFFIAELKPIMPHIQLAPEAVFPHVGEAPLFNLLGQGFYITNTMIATWIAIAIILMIAWNLRKQLKAGSMVPTGISGAIAALLEGFYGMTESIAGKWTKKIFPWFATIFLLVLFVNLMELVPFVDSIGYFHESDHGYAVEKVWGVNTIVQTESAMHEGEEAHQGGYSLVPFVRVASTDLNFTLSLALIAVAMTQYMGFKALGPAYLKKFFDFQGLFAAFKEPRFNPIDVILGGARSLAGILEITAEIAKIVSFTFRLFGVIFAGSVLLFFVGSQVSGLGQSAVLLLELLFGPLQALVFGLLTMIFMSMATISHDYDHGHEEGHH